MLGFIQLLYDTTCVNSDFWVKPVWGLGWFISSEEKKRNEALCGREDTNGDLKQNGLKQLIWRGLKLLNNGKIVVKSKLFP